MPLYEYRCEGCGHRFEVLQRMGDGADGLSCPSCGEPRVSRQLSTFSSTGLSSGERPTPMVGCCQGTPT